MTKKWTKVNDLSSGHIFIENTEDLNIVMPMYNFRLVEVNRTLRVWWLLHPHLGSHIPVKILLLVGHLLLQYRLLLFQLCIPECLVRNKCKDSSVNGKIPLLMLFFNNLSAPLTFPFCIKSLKFMEIFCIYIGVLVDKSIFLLSSNNSLIFPSSPNFNRLSNPIR